jgi:hypothetical protein
MSEKPTFDPTKRYTWGPQDQFTLSGDQFGLILNALRGIITTPEASRILLAAEAANAIDGVMAKAVEDGIVKEAPEEPQLHSLPKE